MTNSGYGDRNSEPTPAADYLRRILSGIDFGELPDAVEPDAPQCPLCNDLGFVYADAGFEGIRECRCQPGRAEKMARYWLKYSGVPPILRDLRLESHPNLHGGHNPGLYDRLMAADVTRTSWFLWGNFSRGKSAIAAALAWRYLSETGESVLWRTLPDLLEEIRQTYDRGRGRDEYSTVAMTEADMIQRYTAAGLLVLDDVGAERLRETGEDSWAADILYRIVGRRHVAMKPTVFTSNLTLGEVKVRVGERITERIIEMTDRGRNIVELTGDNLRG